MSLSNINFFGLTVFSALQFSAFWQNVSALSFLHFQPIGFDPTDQNRLGLIFQTNFQSQEVTYAELTMPRNKGYTPMRADSRNLTDSPINGTTSCCVTASVRYAKIDPTAARPRPPRTVRPPKPDPPPRYTSPPSSMSTETSCNATSQFPATLSDVTLPQQFGVSTAASSVGMSLHCSSPFI